MRQLTALLLVRALDTAVCVPQNISDTALPSHTPQWGTWSFGCPTTPRVCFTKLLCHLFAGTTFLVSPYLMHRDEGAWHHPLSFDPGRWEKLRPSKPLGCLDLMQGLGPNGSYLPFGAPPCLCTACLAFACGVLGTVQLVSLAMWCHRHCNVSSGPCTACRVGF